MSELRQLLFQYLSNHEEYRNTDQVHKQTNKSAKKG